MPKQEIRVLSASTYAAVIRGGVRDKFMEREWSFVTIEVRLEARD